MIEWLSVSDKSTLCHAIFAYAYDKAVPANSQKALQQLMDNMNKVIRELRYED